MTLGFDQLSVTIGGNAVLRNVSGVIAPGACFHLCIFSRVFNVKYIFSHFDLISSLSTLIFTVFFSLGMLLALHSIPSLAAHPGETICVLGAPDSGANLLIDALSGT